jgi:hypothetical protein
MKPKDRQKPRDIDKSLDRISQNISITHAQHLTHMSHISGYEQTRYQFIASHIDRRAYSRFTALYISALFSTNKIPRCFSCC